MSNQRQSRDNRQVTPEWIAEVNQALQDQGMTRLELAKKVGASSGGISHLLNGNVGTSHLVPKITGRTVRRNRKTDRPVFGR